MKIVAGPYACGKTHRLLSLTEGAPKPVRWIVPTATMAARTPGAITLFRFVSQLVPEIAAPSEAALDREIRRALDSLDLPPLRGVRAFGGFRRKLRALVEEISALGVSAAEFAAAVANLPYASAVQRAVASVYRRLEQNLEQRGLALAGMRTRLAAARAGRLRLPAACVFDGFYSFSASELDLLEALDAVASVTVTVPHAWPGASRTMERFADRADIENLPSLLFAPRVEKFSAPSRVQECEEIARRIREKIAGGESARCFGVIVRQPKIYVPLLRSAFRRYGVPAAFYFAEPLERQPAARFGAAVIESLLHGWDLERLHEAVLLPGYGLGATPEVDRLDFEMRKRFPGRGFDGLPLLEERFGKYSAWAGAELRPLEWAAALAGLVEEGGHEAWTKAMAEAAAAMADRACGLEQFWAEATQTVQAAVVRPAAFPDDAVAVVDAMEARQWRFGEAYVCGMLEGEFPAHPAGDALFDDAARRELARLGVPLRTSDDMEAEERALVGVAASRAGHVTFSWPALTAAGEESLPSLLLETFPGEIVATTPLPPPALGRAYRPPSRPVAVPPAAVEPFFVSGKVWRPTEIECFLQCPFQFLGRHLLQLQPPPPEPGDRIDPRVEGTLAHQVLRRVSENPFLALEAALDEELRKLARKEHIPDSHRLLWTRARMRRVLQRFLEMEPERPDWKREYEWPFEFDLIEGLRIKGRIDRFDSKDRQAYAIDYKYSKSSRLRKSAAVQGGLYLLALQRAGFSPQEFSYIALREDAEVVRFAPEPLMEDARQLAIEASVSAAQGNVAAKPADPGLCRFCEFRSACRISESAAMQASAGAAE